MKQNINLYIAAALMLTLGGCNKGLGPEDAGSITIEAGVGDMTKVSYDGNKTRFTEGDQITVYGWLGSAAEVPSTRVVNGVKCTLGTDGTWTPESPMYWAPGGEAHYFLAVYPARKIRRFTDEEFVLDPADYRASDLLIATNLDGVKASDGPVAFSFDHAMAKLVVNLKFRSEFGGAPSVGSVTVNARKTATVNYLTKAVTASGSVQRVSLPDAEAAPEGYSLSFSGLQIPQEGVRKVRVAIGLNEYVYESAEDIPIKAGQYTTLGFIVGREKIDLASVTVSGWETAEDLTGGEALQEEDPYNGHEYVDLGLSVKWATCNVGATKPEEYGDYFAWGETRTKESFDWACYKWGNELNITKYTDITKMTLEVEDDAAAVNWGGAWRMPTKDEAAILEQTKKNTADYTWTWCDGSTAQYAGTTVKGWQIVRNATGATLFLPAAGYRINKNLFSEGFGCFSWTSTLRLFYDPKSAWSLVCNPSSASNSYQDRCEGMPVRPVCAL